MRILRLLAVLVMVLGAGIVPAAAAPAEREGGGRGVRPVPQRSVGFLEGLGQQFVSFLEKAGCTIDPWGRCAASPATTDAGCGIDPLGRCGAKTVTPKAGCRIDPLGRCIVSVPATDAGCHIDPLGGCTPGH